MSRRHQGRRSADRPKPKKSIWGWVAFVAPALLLAVVVGLFGGGTEEPTDGGDAVSFVLPATDGTAVALSDSFGENGALLFFSMGVGCDGCFAQIPEIEAGLEERGITFLPIMVSPPEHVVMEADRWGITLPILIDSDMSVSRAYGMVGVYGHSNSPSHSFALVEPNGKVSWVKHYAEMFVPAESFFAELDAAI